MRAPLALAARALVALAVMLSACKPRERGTGSASASAEPSVARPPSRSASALLVAGVKLQQAGKNAEAEEQLLAAIDTGALSSTELAQAWTIVGITREERDDFARAIEAHDESIAAKSDYEVAWVNKGIALRRSDKPDEAQRAYEKALEINPRYAEAWASIGALQLLHSKDAKKAVESLEKAIALDPKVAVAHANLALAYAELGRFADADVALQRAVEKGYKNEAKMREMIEAARAAQKK